MGVAALKTLLRGGRLLDPAGSLDAVGDLLVEDGRIARVGGEIQAGDAVVLDCSGAVVMPGLVDAHVHLREPGREDEEDVESGTRAAAKGGFTAVCAMPNTEPPCDEGAAVRALLDRAREVASVRVHPVGALTQGRRGERLAEIGDMVAEGAVAFSDDGSSVTDAGMMRLVMDYVKRFGAPVVSHCEDAALVGGGVVNEGAVSTRLGLPGWPAAAEDVIVARDVRLAELTGCRLHIAHMSTAGSVRIVREAKARGVPVTCEVTPHHLFLSEDDITGYDTRFKMNPPLRSTEDVAALREALADGTVDAIATDHAPHAAHEKELEFEDAPFGTTGLECALGVVLTEAVHTGLIELGELVRLMCDGPRAALGLPEVRLAEGMPADITVVDLDAEWVVGEDGHESKSSNCVFEGKRLRGRAVHVLVDGRLALEEGRVVARGGRVV